MNKTVSQEFLPVVPALGLAGAAVAIVGTKVAKALVDKIGSDAAGQTVRAAKALLRSRQTTDLVRVTQSARVEPILLMDQRAAAVPFVQDVVHSLFNMFTGYWLLAVSLDTTINGVSVGRRLDKFATDRDLAEATMSLIDSSFESMNIGLPFANEVLQANFESMQASLEANLPHLTGNSASSHSGDAPDRQEGDEKDKPVTKYAVQKPAEAVSQITNLAVGKVIEVVISEDGKEAKIPVTIRLRVAGMNPKAIVETLAVGGVDMSTRGRWRAWRAGELRFWSDFIMAMDRVDAHRAASMNDETGYYKTVYNRASKNGMAEVLTNGPSLGTASSIIVITEQSKDELERTIGGQLSSFKVRQGIFGQTYSMLLAVIDPDWESVTIYTRGIDMPTKLSARDLKVAGKADSKELMDILKAFQAGRAPGRF